MNEVNFQAGCVGFYRITKHKGDGNGNSIPGTEQVVADWFPNLITDQGLERMGTNQPGVAYADCQVGEGTDTPAFTDTALDVWLAGTTTIESTTNGVQNAAPYFAWQRVRYRFAEGVAAGVLSEVGTGWGTSGSTLFSRALILDGGGLPTTITVLSDEILDVTYEFRLYPPTVDVEGVVTISGVDYDYIARACVVTTPGGPFGDGWTAAGSSFASKGFAQNSYAGPIGAITGQPSGASVQPSVVTPEPVYVPGSKQRDMVLRWDIDRFIAGDGIRSIKAVFSHCTAQYQFDPIIPKNVIGLVMELTFRMSWARHTI